MNSWNWKTITPEENHQYKWEATELKWRHAMKPSAKIRVLNTTASYMGRRDGGELLTTIRNNYSYTFVYIMHVWASAHFSSSKWCELQMFWSVGQTDVKPHC